MPHHGDEPVHEIAKQAEESQSDVVVMGRRGVHWLERLVLGEAAARVVGHVHCSVLVVPTESGIWDKGILLAVDGSRFADAREDPVPRAEPLALLGKAAAEWEAAGPDEKAALIGKLEDEMRLALSHAGIHPPTITSVRRLGGILPQQSEILAGIRESQEVHV